ncbi:hypothetical protein MTP99_013192 [Tenebrio molitor]|nr:hypothetical protein MTP99_013192 [Tenebrio molitor]
MEPSSSTPSSPGNADSTFTSVKQEPTSNPASPLEASSPSSIALRNRGALHTCTCCLISSIGGFGEGSAEKVRIPRSWGVLHAEGLNFRRIGICSGPAE